jgi:hypothetical protein
MRESFGSLLADALECMTRDAPACMLAMARSVGSTRVLLLVDGETAVLRSDGPEICLTTDGDASTPLTDGPTATLVASSSTLLDVLDGRRSLLSAVRDNAVCVRASAADAAGLFDALRSFVEGVARSSDSPSAYERFRSYVAGARLARGGGG